LADQYAETMEKLRTGYRGALERLQEKAQKSGKLEDVLPVRDEIQRLDEKVDPLPPLGATASTELKKLRETYDQSASRTAKAHAGEIVAMADKLIDLLDNESSQLTKAGKIDGALEVNTLREAYENDAGLQEARILLGPTKTMMAGKSISLLKAKRTIMEQGAFWVGTIDGKVGAGSYSPEIEKLAPEGEEHLFLHPPSRTSFHFERPVSRLSSGLFVARDGSVTVRLFVGARKVAETRVEAAEKAMKSWDLKFKATDLIEIEVDPNGDLSNDLFYMVDPVVE
jgi:hypothetical protein